MDKYCKKKKPTKNKTVYFSPEMKARGSGTIVSKEKELSS